MRAFERLCFALNVAVSALLATIVVSGVAAVPPARADDEGGAGATTGAYLDPEGDPTALAAEAGEPLGVVAASTGGGSEQACEWRLTVADDTALGVYDENGQRQHSPTGRWYERWCDGRLVDTGGFGFVPDGEPAAADPAVLAAQAVRSVDIDAPPLATSPAADRQLYAQLPTWLWIDPAWWRPYQATATAGSVSSTVTASPSRVTWDTGDGFTTICDGPGLPWRQGLAEEATDCSHVYEHSSAGEPDGTFTLQVTVELEVAWTSNVGTGGSLAAITRSTSRPVLVGEIQAIETE